jgi:septum formation protein
LRLLRAAGLEPVVVVSGVDESQVSDGSPRDVVQRLAALKAEAVANRLESARGFVIGCDSLLELDGVAHGKPADAADAVARWQAMRGRTGILLTGHCVIDAATRRRAQAVDATTVRFGLPTDDEIKAYVDSGEPLEVAGGFTIDGRGAAFVDGVDGNPGNVIGLSLPVLRALLAELGSGIVELWR